MCQLVIFGRVWPSIRVKWSFSRKAVTTKSMSIAAQLGRQLPSSVYDSCTCPFLETILFCLILTTSNELSIAVFTPHFFFYPSVDLHVENVQDISLTLM